MSKNKEGYYIISIAFSYVVANFGGSFASGREVVEYFVRYGAKGFWGTWVSIFLFAYLGLVALDLARRWQAFDYHTFVVKLYEEFLPKPVASLGFWVFEVVYLVLCILILGIITAAGASLATEEWGLSYTASSLIMASAVLLVVGFGEIGRAHV